MVIDAGFGELSGYFMQQVVTWLQDSKSQIILLLLHKDAVAIIDILDKTGGAKAPFVLHMYKESSARNVSVSLQGKDIEVITFDSPGNETKVEGSE
jgi:hypothetical protein